CGVETIETVVTRAKVDFAVDDRRARFDMAAGLELPELLAVVGPEAIELAIAVLVKAFADIEPSVREAWRRENLLHLLAVVEAPKRLAVGAVEAIKRAVGPENAIVGGRDVEALARYQRRRSDRAVVRSAKAPDQ